ncbi:nucleotide exchange factor GrpE [Nocardioides salsibiostraticola]
MTQSPDLPQGEAAGQPPPGDGVSPEASHGGSFGDAAAEMPNETEVEVTMDSQPEHGEAQPATQPATEADGDISGVADMVEEGAPLEPSDLLDEQTAESDELTVAQMALAERTTDLQRLQAEFVNYKRRVDRDRDLIKENATYAALVPIVEVLDNIDRAREHGELDPGFKSIAEQLERVVAGSGLVKFGAPGDAFDPAFHEALSHLGQDPEVTVTTCKVVAKAGYKIGARVVRAAQVLVADPVED